MSEQDQNQQKHDDLKRQKMPPNFNANSRHERHISHALVEVRRFKWLPFFIHSAVLLDISVNGFKIEFTAEVSSEPGQVYWLHVPLAPLGLKAPSKLICKAQCRWFDQKRYRIGGVFLNLDDTQRLVIQQILDILTDKGIKSS